MTVYIIVLIILIYNTIQYDFKAKTKNKKRALLFEFVVLVLVAGFRYKVGGDTHGYMLGWNGYPVIHNIDGLYLSFQNERYSVLWVLLCSICKTIYDSFYFFQFVHAIIVNASFVYFFSKYSKRPFTCILIYAIFFYFNYNTEILRSAISASLFLFSYKYLIDKKLIQYYLFCLAAIGFHTEAFITLFFPLCLLFNSNSNVWKKIIIAFAVSLFILNTVDLTSLEIIQSIQYGTIEEFLNTEKAELNLNGIIAYSFNIVPLIILLLYSKDNYRFGFFLLFSIFIYVMTFKYTVMFSRIMDFIYPILIVKVANFSMQANNNQFVRLKMITLLFIVCSCYSYSWSRFYFGNIGGKSNKHDSYKLYFPYTNWIDEEEDVERQKLIILVR